MANNFLDNLISSWEMEEGVSPFIDQHSSNNLSISGVTLQQTGLFNFCGDYDGVNDGASISGASQIGLNASTASMTFEVWVKIDNPNTASMLISKISSLGGGVYYRMFINRAPIFNTGTASLAISINGGANEKLAIGTTNVNTNVKHHIVGVIDRLANLIRIYVDGLQEGTADITGITSLDNAHDFSVGIEPGGSNPTDGLIDRVRVWGQRALSASEILELYNSGNGIPYPDFESGEPTPVVLPGTTPFVPSDSIKHILNSGRFQGSIVLDTTNEIGKIRLTSVASLRDTFLTMFKATSKNDIHLNTSAGNKLKAISALDPNTSTSEDIINAVRNS